jgi:hypothetical protein
LLSLSEQGITNWLKERINCAETLNGQLVFIVEKKRICLPTFCSLFGISDYKFNVAYDSYKVLTVYKRTRSTFNYPWKQFLEFWFLNIISWFCDIMPNSDSKYLPVYFTKDSLYQMAVAEHEIQEGSRFSYSSFRSFWKTNHKSVKISKSFKMGQCDTYLQLKYMKSSGRTKEEIAKAKAEHNKLHAAARQYAMN